MYELSFQEIESALYSVSPSDRDVWVRMGMAIKNELGDSGFELWDRWSQQAENYQYKAAQSSWRSFKMGFGPTLGSLIHEAKLNGWEPRQTIQKKSKEEVERQIAQWRAKQAEQEQLRQETSEQVSQKATAEWNQASNAPNTHPYLQKKQVKSHGLKLSAHGDLLVPAMDIDGRIWTLQRIKADGSKLFSKGGKKAGCFHWLSSKGQAVSRLQDIILCEGYATGASLFEALNTHVVVCFDAGNLQPVAQAIRQAFPENRLVIAADNDQYGEKNTGQLKAMAVCAQTQNCWMVLPQFSDTSSRPTDFNDLHILVGLDGVKAQVLKGLGGKNTFVNHMLKPGNPIAWLLTRTIKHDLQKRFIRLVVEQPLVAQVFDWPEEMSPDDYPALIWPVRILNTQKALQIQGPDLLRAIDMEERVRDWIVAMLAQKQADIPVAESGEALALEVKGLLEQMQAQVKALSKRIETASLLVNS
jgi:phage/plasmid primase-like uncharacterized protein